MALPKHLITGLRGEQLAARFLQESGYDILEANYSTHAGETDIIAQSKSGILCFVEVKTRSPGGMFSPAEAVDYLKKKRLINNAATYIKTCKPQLTGVRFDIAEVILHNLYSADIKIIENAFGQGAFSLT